jgi:hypothetical protein
MNDPLYKLILYRKIFEIAHGNIFLEHQFFNHFGIINR